MQRAWPRTPREQRLWMESGRAMAAAVRFQLVQRALGNTPPTRGELERIVASGPPEWFQVPRETSYSRTVWQRGRGGRA